MADDEDTVVPDPAAEDTTVVERDDPEDRTIVVVRDDPEDRTVVVEREDPEDRTVVVERGDPEDRTVVVERRGRETDKTVVIDRRRKKGPSVPDPESVLTVLPSRRGIRTAPVEPGAGRRAVEPLGANAVESYAPRQIAPVPSPAPPVPRAAEARRTDAPSMPSVARRSRTSGAVALLVFAGACVVSAAGVVAVIVWFVRG